MSSNEHRPAQVYSERNEREYRAEIDRQLRRTHKRDEQFILISPDGSPFIVSVTDAGVLQVDPA